MLKKYREKRRQRWFKKQRGRTIAVLWQWDLAMKKEGWSRQRRKQWWRDFTSSSEKREGVFNEILKAK